MPAALTITSSDFFNFVSKTRAKASQVNTNNDMWRGNLIPFDPNTIAAAGDTYNLGTSEHQWDNVYTNNFPQVRGHGIEETFLQIGPHGLGLFQDTVTTFTIRKHDGTNLSSTNYGIVRAHAAYGQHNTNQYNTVTITANVNITVGGTLWQNGETNTDNTYSCLDVIFLNDASVGAFGVTYYSGNARPLINKVRCTTASWQINAENVLTNTTVNTISSATPCFWADCSYRWSGGVTSHEWTFLSIGSSRVGHSDGFLRGYRATVSGFRLPSNPGYVIKWTMHGRSVHYEWYNLSLGEINSTTITISCPIPPDSSLWIPVYTVVNHSPQTIPGMLAMTTGSHIVTIQRDGASSAWSNTPSSFCFSIQYMCWDDYFKA